MKLSQELFDKIRESTMKYIESCFVDNFKKSYISKKSKLCYMIVQKSACTTLRNWFVDLEGMRDRVEETRKRLASELVKKIPKMSFDEAVRSLHIAEIFAKTSPDVTVHTFDEAMAAFATPHYFRFIVVRNPYTRVFSAWVDKVLQDSYRHSRKYFRTADFYCKPVFTIQQCAENFEEFLSYIDKNRRLLYQNRHWAPQFALTRPDRVTYDCVAKLEDPAPLVKALRDRLGPDVPPPLRGKLNKNPLAYSGELLTPGAQKLIGKLYAEDFKAFAYDTEPPATPVVASQAEVEAELYHIVEKRFRRSLHERNALEDRIKALQGQRLRAAYYGLRGKLGHRLGFDLSLA